MEWDEILAGRHHREILLYNMFCHSFGPRDWGLGATGKGMLSKPTGPFGFKAICCWEPNVYCPGRALMPWMALPWQWPGKALLPLTLCLMPVRLRILMLLLLYGWSRTGTIALTRHGKNLPRDCQQNSGKMYCRNLLWEFTGNIHNPLCITS